MKVVNKYIPYIALLVAVVLWSSSFIALKIAFTGYHPMVAIFLRMVVGSLCFLFIFKRVARSLELRKSDIFLILFMALCEPCLYFLFEAKAIENTTASQAGIISALLPILVMIAATVFLKEKTGVQGWLGGFIAMLGVCWLTLESSPSATAPNPMLGNIYEFIAMICATGYTVAMRFLTIRYSPLFLTAVQAVVGSFFYFPVLFLPSVKFPDNFELVPTLAVIYLGSVITLGAYGLYNYALKHVPAGKAASFACLIPVFAVIMGWLILGETFTYYQSIAAVVIIGGVWFSQRSSNS